GMSSAGGTEKLPPGAVVVVVDADDWADRLDEHAARLYTASAAATPPALRRNARRSTPARRAASSERVTISRRMSPSWRLGGRGTNSPLVMGPGGSGNSDPTTPEWPK
ncbi:MAG: hypothetical protein QOD38_2224, partial [Acidimicrobiaceae bacterium]